MRIERGATPHSIRKRINSFYSHRMKGVGGSHYLTFFFFFFPPARSPRPIIRKDIEPILKRWVTNRLPRKFLDIKIEDMSVGSSVRHCRNLSQLAEELVEAWRSSKCAPDNSCRLKTSILMRAFDLTRRCLYAVERRNPMAGIWRALLWLAPRKEYPFTFLDHRFASGDSLVGRANLR